MNKNLKQFFDEKVLQYNSTDFIKDDPISIPHFFSKKQDIEIAGLFAAIFSWGNRTTIINKSKTLMQHMDDAPYDFICHHQPKDLKALEAFKHRTFKSDDLFYFIEFLTHFYRKYDSLEFAFTVGLSEKDANIEKGLIGFKKLFFAQEHFKRTEKHISSPLQNSSCKRLCMYLRWMVRNDAAGVDFGIWKTIKPAQLICPIDVHVARVAKRFNLLSRKQTDWISALELTNYLRQLDATDPVKYDFALFGLGVIEKYN